MVVQGSSSRVEQDYLRLIWKSTEWDGDAITPGGLAEATGTVPSSVTGALSRLTKRGLIEREPHGAVTLTEAGRTIALGMVRRHRLIETFLVERLRLGWDEVHAEAEELEHAVSDRLLDRIDEELDFPTRDPHGDLIPDRDGRLDRPDGTRLSGAEIGRPVQVVRVSDHDPELLRYLADVGLVPDAEVAVQQRRPFAGSVSMLIGGAPVELSLVAANAVWIRPIG